MATIFILAPSNIEVSGPSWAKADDMKDFDKTFNSAVQNAKGDIGCSTRKGLFGEIVPLPQPQLAAAMATAGAGRKSALIVQDLSADDAEPVDWAWPEHFARGELNLLAGLPGAGKSQLLLAFSAVITNGGTWPTGEACKRGGVLLVQAEDSIKKTVIPRAVAAGVDFSRMKVMNTVKKLGDLDERMVQLDQDLEEFKLWFSEHPEFDTLMFDPLSAYLGKADSHKDAEVRAVLTPLAAFASENSIMVIVLHHLNKGTGRSAGDRLAGSAAFRQIPRTFHMALTDPEDADTHILQTMQKNLGKGTGGFSYKLETRSVKTRSHPNGMITSAVAWGASKTIDVDEALEPARNKGRASKADAATEWLKNHLASGPKESLALAQDAKENFISSYALKSAREALGVVSEKRGTGSFDPWFSMLPEHRAAWMAENRVVPMPGPK